MTQDISVGGERIKPGTPVWVQPAYSPAGKFAGIPGRKAVYLGVFGGRLRFKRWDRRLGKWIEYGAGLDHVIGLRVE